MRNFYRYLPVSDEVRTSSLYVIADGYTEIPPYSPYPPQYHPGDHYFQWKKGRVLQEYQIIYITKGGGIFESRTSGSHRIQAGDLFMLFPGEWHRYSPDLESGWVEHWIAFQGNRAEEILADYPLTRAQPVLNVGRSETLMEEFSRIAQEMRDEQVGYQKIIAVGVLHILAAGTAISLRQNYAGTDIVRVVEAAKTFLRARVNVSVNIEEMAAELGVSYSWFRRAFRQYTGLSPTHYHLQLRINQASELLRTTTLTVAAIGQRCGFASDHYFYRIFRKKTGYTPGDYRAITQSPQTEGVALLLKPENDP
jgi:AraC-like DNA-binding protein